MKRLLFGTGALFALSLLFSIQAADVSPGFSTINCESCRPDKLQASQPADEISSTHDGWEHPFGNDTNGTEPPEENESIDPDDLNEWTPTPPITDFDLFSGIVSFEISKVSISSFNASFLNRKVIPLFVLQHSWKNFLS